LLSCPQVIQRVGDWLLDDSSGTSHISPGLSIEALLALGFWPGAAQDFSGFWAERFHVAVPEVLVQLLMPGLQQLEQQAAAHQPAAVTGTCSGQVTPDAAVIARVLRMGAVIVVQDALELALKFPENPVHALLAQQECFRLVNSSQICTNVVCWQQPLVEQGSELVEQGFELVEQGSELVEQGSECSVDWLCL
jgi:hypothetical protein